MKPSSINTLDANTESKIKEAARILFHAKGYASTRTRDIAIASGVNLALLNYYFRSKQQLFETIMFETLFQFTQHILIIFNDEKTSLLEKVDIMAEKYIEMILKDPEMPMFVMNELRNNAAGFLNKIPIVNMVKDSVLVKQYQQAVAEGKSTEPNPLHFIINLLALTIFPFIASPFIQKIGALQARDFEKLMLERKTKIPQWVKAMYALW